MELQGKIINKNLKKLKLDYQESNFKLKSSNKRLLDEQNDLKELINHLVKGIKAQKDKNRQSDTSQLKNTNNDLVKKLYLVEKKRDELEKSLNQKILSKEQQKQRESLRRDFRR